MSMTLNSSISRGGAESAEKSMSPEHENDKYSFTMKGVKSMKIIHESANECGAAAYIH